MRTDYSPNPACCVAVYRHCLTQLAAVHTWHRTITQRQLRWLLVIGFCLPCKVLVALWKRCDFFVEEKRHIEAPACRHRDRCYFCFWFPNTKSWSKMEPWVGESVLCPIWPCLLETIFVFYSTNYRQKGCFEGAVTAARLKFSDLQ